MAKKKEVPEQLLSLSERVQKSMIEMCPKESIKVIKDPTIKHWNSTGSMPLDMHIGQGPGRYGFPGGRVVELNGPPSGGKTGLALETIAAAQHAGGFGHLITIEGLDPNYATNICGCNITDPDRWLMTEVNSLEGAAGAMESTIREGFNAERPIVMVTDSISALGVLADSWQEKGPEESTSSAAGAKFMHGWFRRGPMYYLSGSPITLILIRHTTESPRAFDGEKTTHGKSLDYNAWVRLKIYRSAMDKKDGEVQGYWRNINCIKSKVGVDAWKFQQPMYMGVGRDPGFEVLNFLINERVLSKKSGGWVEIDMGDGTKQQQQPWMWSKMYRENSDWRDYFDNLVMTHLLEHKFKFGWR